jgi:hypothetical protein
MTYKVGIIGEFMKWTKRVVTDPAAAANTPKRWAKNAPLLTAGHE